MCNTCGNRVDGLSKSSGREYILCTGAETKRPARGYIEGLYTIPAQQYTHMFSTSTRAKQHLRLACYPRYTQDLLITITTYINK
jgi:hypothetical protein